MEIIKIPKEKVLPYSAASIFAVILLLYVFLYEPLISELKKAGKVCKTVEASIIETRNSLNALKISGERKALIAENEVSPAIAELTKKSKSVGIDFISITPMPIIITGDPQYNILPVEMEIESTYEELIAFIGLLKELKESLVTLGNFSIIPNENGELLKVKLIINIYISVT